MVRECEKADAKRDRNHRVYEVGNKVPNAVVRVNRVVQENRENEVDCVNDNTRNDLLACVKTENSPFATRVFELSFD